MGSEMCIRDSITIEEIETGAESTYVTGVGLVHVDGGTREAELVD